MQKEKIAVIGLIIIIVGALSVFILLQPSEDGTGTVLDDIFANLFGEAKKEFKGPLQIGDCADVNYIGRFQVNNTVFDTSYEDVAREYNLYDENRPYEPLKIFVNPHYNLTAPEGYEDYISDMIPGFLSGLVDMNVSETKTVVLDAENAYGDWNESLAETFGMGAYPLETVIDSTASENISQFLVNFPDINMTEGAIFDYGAIAFEEEGILDATIVTITDENITYRLLPENGSSVLLPIFNWYVTFIVENDTAFTMRSNIELGHIFSIESYYGSMHFKVTAANESSVSLAMNIDAPKDYFVGQTLIFELKVVKAYDTSSQLES